MTPRESFVFLARDGRARGSRPDAAAAWRLAQLLCDPHVALLLDEINFLGLKEFADFARRNPAAARRLLADGPRLPVDATARPLNQERGVL